MPPNWRPGLDEATKRTIKESGRLVPISPRGGLFLLRVPYFPTERTGIAAVYDAFARTTHARFAGLFRRTWFRLPRRARMRLLHYWRRESWAHHDSPYSPRIALLPDWPQRPWNPDAVCLSECRCGHDFFYWACALNQMPDECASATIAGGLARALYFIHKVVDARTHGLPKPRRREDWMRMPSKQQRQTAPAEIAVQKWLRRWGFDLGAVEKWVLRKKDIRGVDVRTHAVFRYPPALDIPIDLAKYARMEPLPVLRGRPLPVFVE